MGMLKCGITGCLCQRTLEQIADPSAISGTDLILSLFLLLFFLSHTQPLCKAFYLHVFLLAVFREVACYPRRLVSE